MLGYESLSSYSNISHFVTTRQGGCSEGNYASFNCTPYSGDEAEKVRRNQTLLMEGMSQTPEELVIPVQTHETNCLLGLLIYRLRLNNDRRCCTEWML